MNIPWGLEDHLSSLNSVRGEVVGISLKIISFEVNGVLTSFDDLVKTDQHKSWATVSTEALTAGYEKSRVEWEF